MDESWDTLVGFGPHFPTWSVVAWTTLVCCRSSCRGPPRSLALHPELVWFANSNPDSIGCIRERRIPPQGNAAILAPSHPSTQPDNMNEPCSISSGT